LDRFLVGEQRVELLLIGFDDLLVLLDDPLVIDDGVETGDHFFCSHEIAPYDCEWIDDSSTKAPEEDRGSSVALRGTDAILNLRPSILNPLRVASWIDFSSQQELLPLTHLAPDRQLPGRDCGFPPRLRLTPSRK